MEDEQPVRLEAERPRDRSTLLDVHVADRQFFNHRRTFVVVRCVHIEFERYDVALLQIVLDRVVRIEQPFGRAGVLLSARENGHSAARRRLARGELVERGLFVESPLVRFRDARRSNLH